MQNMSRRRGDVVVFEDGMGNAGFVSHQWVAKQHPDPEFKQMKVLQGVLRRLLKTKGFVPLDILTEAMVPSAKGIPFEDFQSRPLFLWYDYFSVPQLEQGYECSEESLQNQENAISSIPAYVAKCRYYFALCPTVDCPEAGKVLTLASWAARGWCRLERASRELSENSRWILIQSSAALEVVGTAFSMVTGPVGEGDFTVEKDKQKLALVMSAIVKRKLMLSLQVGDLPSYRRHLNLQSVHLKGLDVEPMSGLALGLDVKPPGSDELVSFLYENGFSKVNRKDSAGWWPLHYAALSGRPALIKALILERADPNRRSDWEEPELGFPRWVSPLDVALFYKQNEAAQLLIQMRARMDHGLHMTTVSCLAAASDNVEGIRLISVSGGRLLGKNFFGHTSLDSAACFGCMPALEEVVRLASPSDVELSRALYFSMINKGGSAQVVQRLLHLRADVDFQFDVRRDMSHAGRLLILLKTMQRSLGRGSVHWALVQPYGRTPLMGALQSAQHEGAAALIAAGARLDIMDYLCRKAADFATESIPIWLQKGLQGDLSECRRVTFLALSDDELVTESI